jgi:hypothetical protein
MKYYQIEHIVKPEQYLPLLVIDPLTGRLHPVINREIAARVMESKGTSLSSEWPEYQVRFPDWGRPAPDLSVLFDVLVFSQNAKHVFMDLLGANGEFLPLKSANGDYFIYNCPEINALDRKNSVLNDPFIDLFALKAKKIINQHLFWLPSLDPSESWPYEQDQSWQLCSEDFKTRCETYPMVYDIGKFSLVFDDENPDFVDERYRHPEVWLSIKAKAEEKKAKRTAKAKDKR